MSKYNVRKFVKEDYKTILDWFEEWSWDVWKLEIFSPYSYIVEFKGEPILYTSFYKYEGCPCASMGFTISKKDAPKLAVGRAISMGLDHVFAEAESIGVKGLEYATDKESKVMVDFFVKKGGEITDNGDAYIAVKGLNGYDMEFYYEGKKDE